MSQKKNIEEEKHYHFTSYRRFTDRIPDNPQNLYRDTSHAGRGLVVPTWHETRGMALGVLRGKAAAAAAVNEEHKVSQTRKLGTVTMDGPLFL